MRDTTQKIKVLIADDHQMMLDGLRTLLNNEPDIIIVAEATNGMEVINRLRNTEVDVAVIDITMPELDGCDTVLRIKQTHPQIKILILSLHKGEKEISQLLGAGVDGYIIKERGSEELVKAIRLVSEGKDYFDAEVNRISRRSLSSRHVNVEKTIQLTDREIDVLLLLAESLSSREIGQKLHVSESTVETHKKNMIQKLNLPNARHLKTYAVQNADKHKKTK